MKTVQGGLLVLIGLGVLWLAVTGRLDKIGEAWDLITTNRPASSPQPSVAPPAARQPATVAAISSLSPPVLSRAWL